MISELSQTELAYLAGFFDGEGCIHIARWFDKVGGSWRHNLLVVISQKNERYLEQWCSKVALGVIKRAEHPTGPVWAWRMTNQQAASFLKVLNPYLILKREQAELAIMFQSSMTKSNRRLSADTIIARDLMTMRMKELKQYPNTTLEESACVI